MNDAAATPAPARPLKPVAAIEQWRVAKLGGFGQDRLYGTVYGHHDAACPNGTTIWTSELVNIDPEAGVAETRHTIYTLGTPLE